jgi:hypothetical protein
MKSLFPAFLTGEGKSAFREWLQRLKGGFHFRPSAISPLDHRKATG